MTVSQFKHLRFDLLGCLFLAVCCSSTCADASETLDHFVIQSRDGEQTYCLMTMPEGWHLERLPKRLNAWESFLISPLFGELPSVSIDIFQSDTDSENSTDVERSAGFLMPATSIAGDLFLDMERKILWSRTVDERLITITVEAERNDFRYVFRFLGIKSQRPTFEPTVLKVVDSLNFSPEAADIEQVLKSSSEKEKNLKKTIADRKWSSDNQPDFEMTLEYEESTRWLVWIATLFVVAAVLVCLIVAERVLRARQEEAFAKEITDYMDERRTPKGYDRVSPHFNSKSEPPPTLRIEGDDEEESS